MKKISLLLLVALFVLPIVSFADELDDRVRVGAKIYFDDESVMQLLNRDHLDMSSGYWYGTVQAQAEFSARTFGNHHPVLKQLGITAYDASQYSAMFINFPGFANRVTVAELRGVVRIVGGLLEGDAFSRERYRLGYIFYATAVIDSVGDRLNPHTLIQALVDNYQRHPNGYSKEVVDFYRALFMGDAMGMLRASRTVGPSPEQLLAYKAEAESAGYL